MGKLQSRVMLGAGAAILLISIIYNSSILAFIGLGLVFWGVLLLYIQPEEYTRKVLLDAAVKSSLKQLNQILQEVDCRGKAIYLPPKYFRNPETSKIYIPKEEDGKPPPPEHILQQENGIFIENSQGILLTPAGAELASLFEKTLGTSFTKLDLKYLQENLPKLFIEDLEIAEALELEIEHGEVVHSKITNSVYRDIYKQAMKLSRICNAIGCPICSSIACALAKATGKPVTIERTEASEDGKILEAYYRILQD